MKKALVKTYLSMVRLENTLKRLGSDGLLYAKHRIKGTPYVAFMAEHYDREVAIKPDWGLSLDRRFQLDYLKRHGLSPEMTVLDYGCGAAAAGRFMIDFLNAGKYVGVDISSGVLEEAKRRIGKAGVAGKCPEFYHIPFGDLDVLSGKVFDIVWAQSVLTHMPPEDIRALLKNIRRFMHPQSVFYATFALTPYGIRQKRFKDWYYSPDFFEKASRDFKFRYQRMTDWVHPSDKTGTDYMAKLTLEAS